MPGLASPTLETEVRNRAANPPWNGNLPPVPTLSEMLWDMSRWDTLALSSDPFAQIGQAAC